MGTELKLADFKINVIEYRDKLIKLKLLINQVIIKGLIVYADYNFLPYPISTPQPTTDYFNLFLGFLAKPLPEINNEIMDTILWHTKNIISDKNVKLHKYLWDW